MTKTFFTVADDFDGLLSLAGHPVAYQAGDLIILDSDDPESRAIRDLGLSDLSNSGRGRGALTSLIVGGSLAYNGEMGDPSLGSGGCVYAIPLPLGQLADGDIIRFKPGFQGRVQGFSGLSLVDATTAGKSASVSIGIGGTDLSDEINTATVASGTTPVVFVVETPDETYTTDEIAYDALPATVKAALVAAGIATADVTVGGSAGDYTFTWTEGLADTDITLSILRNEIVTVVVDATGGDFTLDYAASGDPETIVANATESAFQDAVDALLLAASITDPSGATSESATVVRSGAADSYTYTITGHNGANLSAFTTVATGLTGGAGTATRTVVQAGGATNVSAATTVGGGGNRIVGASGNPATLDLTSANVGDGTTIAGEAIAGGNNPKHGNFTADDEIVVIYNTSTPFIEGGVLLTLFLLRTA